MNTRIIDFYAYVCYSEGMLEMKQKQAKQK